MQSFVIVDLKVAFHSLRLLENSKDIVKSYHILVALHICIKEHFGLNISPSIWQSYINSISDCLQSRKYCEAIIYDLVLFMPTKKSHIAK